MSLVGVAHGWNDGPPPHTRRPLPGPHEGDTLTLSGGGDRARRARPVWHASLAGRLLKEDGSGTPKDMIGAPSPPANGCGISTFPCVPPIPIVSRPEASLAIASARARSAARA